MPRVIAGTARGRPLKALPGDRTRPTSDRVKEALFSSLGQVIGWTVLDLYAGSGALGIEALSRGAAHAVLVEQDRRTADVIRQNLQTAGVDACGTVLATTVASYCANPSGGPFDLVLMDPPYAIGVPAIETALAALVDAGALTEGARIVLERATRDPGPPPGVLVHDRDRTYGETLLRYLTHRPGAVPNPQGVTEL
ncbi:16S rRNA (guanine(966)-N(2))-methyltransferase RsmD [soil metagenome]